MIYKLVISKVKNNTTLTILKKKFLALIYKLVGRIKNNITLIILKIKFKTQFNYIITNFKKFINTL